VIAKITRGERAGDIAAYLHGPGKANEHEYTVGNVRHSGGMVIGGNLGGKATPTGRSGRRICARPPATGQISASRSGRYRCVPHPGTGSSAMSNGATRPRSWPNAWATRNTPG
jgi:hypothetical protein